MLNFDFITDDQFRVSLESDYRELEACFQCRAWKAAHVLAGSIIEALLVEYLVVSNIHPAGKDPLTIVLGEAIRACVDANVLSTKSGKLSDVIKDYRNLIHPGRVIRLQEEFGENTAKVALSLVEIIASEVARKRKENYGLTAEQIVRKLSIDEGARPLIPHLLSETKEYERRRLVKGVIKDSYDSEISKIFDCNARTLDLLKVCYRLALTSLPDRDQIKAAETFAVMVRQESAEQICTYADAFFSCNDLKHLSPNDVVLVKQHIFSRWEGYKPGAEFPESFLEVLEGIGPYLDKGDTSKFANLCIRFALSSSGSSQDKFKLLLVSEFDKISTEELQILVIKQIETWKKFATERGYSEDKIKRLEYLSNNCIEIPF